MAKSRYQAPIKKSTSFTLNITSMTDMFTILLVFLLQTYSTAEVQITLDKDIRLPSSNTSLNPVNGVKIILTKSQLKLDETVLSSLDHQVFKKEDLEPQDQHFIKPLFEELKKINTAQNSKKTKVTQILLQADASLPYDLLRKVFYTASMAGFPQLKLVTTVGN